MPSAWLRVWASPARALASSRPSDGGEKGLDLPLEKLPGSGPGCLVIANATPRPLPPMPPGHLGLYYVDGSRQFHFLNQLACLKSPLSDSCRASPVAMLCLLAKQARLSVDTAFEYSRLSTGHLVYLL